jgi:hypothetical protein
MALAEDLKAAASAGLISADQAETLTRFLAQRQAGVAAGAAMAVPLPDDGERFKLIGGFNDLFVAIGIGLVYWALLSFLGAGTIASPVALMTASAVVAWALAEVFTRRMRLALPSILLALIFCVSAGGVLGVWFVPGIDSNLWDTLAFATSRTALLPGLAVLAASALHFWRFRVPIDVAIMVAAVLATLLTAFAQLNTAFVVDHGNALILGTGLIIFAIAMAFDMSDPIRRTWRSDAAFWLHMMAAPAIVHPAIFGIAGGPTQLTQSSPAVILILFAVFSLVAIIIDRRALIVSALAYAGGAIGYYLNDDLFGGTGFAVLALGAVILGLSAGWRSIRRLIVPLLPLGALKDRLPPA